MASKNIKGITIEIGGDTTKLGKAMQASSSESISLQKELKQVNNLLKFDPKNTELLAQKQQILKDAINSTSEKLNVLKEAERQVQQQFEQGKVSEQQYRELQREVISTQQSLDNLKKAADETGEALKNTGSTVENLNDNLEDTQKKTEKTKEKFDKAGKVITAGMAAAGSAISGAAVAAVNFDAEYDRALNNVIAQTNATADETKELGDTLKEIYESNFGEDLDDVARAMSSVKTQTKATGEELKNTTKNALLFRDTFGMEVEENIRAANSLMKQFSISADEAYTLMAQGAQKGLNANQDMCDVINEYAVQYASAGLSAEDMFNMLVNGAKQGTWSIDKLGDAFKEFNIRMSDGTANEYLKSLGLNAQQVTAKFQSGGDSAKEAMQMISDALKACDNQTTQYTAGVGLMGTMYEDMGLEAVTALLNTQGEISKTSKALDDINAKKCDDLKNQFSELGRSVKTEVLQPLGDELQPEIENVIGEVKENLPQIKNIVKDLLLVVTNLITFFTNNGNEVITVIAAIGAGMLAWNVVSMIQGLVTVIKTWTEGTKGLAAAQAILNKTLLANPIGLIVAAIAAVVTALVVAYNKCEWFRDAVNSLFSGITEFLRIFVEGIKLFITSIWEKIQEIWGYIEAFAQIMLIAIQQVLSDVGQFFSDAWAVIKIIWDEVQPYFALLWESIKIIFSAVGEVLGSFFGNAWNIISSIWSVATSFFSTIWNTIKGIFSVVQAVLTGDFQGAWEGIKNIFSGFSDFFATCWNAVKNIFGSVTSFFSDAFGAAWSAIKNIFSNFGSFFSGLWNTIKNTFTNLGTNIADAISGAIKSGINGIIGFIENTINGAIGLINGAIDLINKIPGVSIGKIGELNLPRLAHGGILTEGSAMVAEAGPELIHMVNGKTIVTPLTPSAKNTAMQAAGGQTQNTTNEINVHIENFNNNRDTDIEELTEEMLRAAENIKERNDIVYA